MVGYPSQQAFWCDGMRIIIDGPQFAEAIQAAEWVVDEDIDLQIDFSPDFQPFIDSLRKLSRDLTVLQEHTRLHVF